MSDASVPTSRRAARETVLRILYMVEVGRPVLDDAMQETIAAHKLDQNAADFVEALVREVLANKLELDATITRHASEYKAKDLTVVDRNILRMAISEVRSDLSDATQATVAVEAMELARKYSAEEATKFIHGVLGGVFGHGKSKIVVPFIKIPTVQPIGLTDPDPADDELGYDASGEEEVTEVVVADAYLVGPGRRRPDDAALTVATHTPQTIEEIMTAVSSQPSVQNLVVETELIHKTDKNDDDDDDDDDDEDYDDDEDIYEVDTLDPEVYEYEEGDDDEEDDADDEDIYEVDTLDVEVCQYEEGDDNKEADDDETSGVLPLQNTDVLLTESDCLTPDANVSTDVLLTESDGLTPDANVSEAAVADALEAIDAGLGTSETGDPSIV